MIIENGETEGDKVKTYTYDTVGNRTSANIEGIAAAYACDRCNRLLRVSFEGGGVSYSYDDAGRLTGETRGDGSTVGYTYDTFGRLIEKRNVSGENTEVYALTYYADGNIASKTANGAVTEYEYDGMGRLTRENGTQYTYDTRGNRAAMTTGADTTLYEYDRSNRLKRESCGNSRTDYRYDANGNLTTRAKGVISGGAGAEKLTLGEADGESSSLAGAELTVYSYDTRDRLTGVQSDNGMIASYSYGADNMRRSKTVNGETTRHIWDGGRIVGESNESGELTAKYYYGNTILAADTGGGVEYYQSDSHGDISEYSGNTYTYDAFGNRETESAEDANPFGYCGEYYDRETGMIYLRNRYYDPGTGRFISEDPAKDGVNWYVYCGGNPVMFVDPWGEEYIVVSGGDYSADSHPGYSYNFIEPAIKKLRELKKINNKESITWMIANAGWRDNDIENFSKVADNIGAKIVYFSNKNEFFYYINNKQNGEKRLEDKINKFVVFSHGLQNGTLSLGYNYSNYNKALDISIEDIKCVSSKAFNNANSWFYSCNTGKDIDEYGYSFAARWKQQVGGTVGAYNCKTTYEYIMYPRNYNKLKVITGLKIKNARKEYGFCQNGSSEYPVPVNPNGQVVYR